MFSKTILERLPKRVYDPSFTSGYYAIRCDECSQSASYIDRFPHSEGCTQTTELVYVFGRRVLETIVAKDMMENYPKVLWDQPKIPQENLPFTFSEFSERWPIEAARAIKGWQWFIDERAEEERKESIKRELEHLLTVRAASRCEEAANHVKTIPRKPTVAEKWPPGTRKPSTWERKYGKYYGT